MELEDKPLMDSKDEIYAANTFLVNIFLLG